MSFSVHRPGRFGSDGRIAFDGPSEPADELYIDDVRGAWEAPAGPDDPFDQPESGQAPATDDPGDAADRSSEPDAGTEPAAAPAGRAARAGRRRPRTPASRRLAVLGGADGSVLDHVPTETPRFVQMFFVLAGTALVSAISMYFALTTGVRILAWMAVPLAIVWALIIFNLDRFLTSTMRSTHSIGRLIGLAIPRVIMAAVIGIVVAEPLVLQIFSNGEVNATNVVQAQSDQDAVTTGPEREALDAARDRVAALESQAASGVVEGANTTSASATAAQQSVDDRQPGSPHSSR
ncbi:DUF4407 domain-containing protein [Microbacterium yannicii]|uniref:DUF4407 domain-containing protein n=1 Tax=Microbacterium yannicii TaxID=671622 RepID=UPI0003085868|nr:DUF4407 domain-containing protein [Microbacterium yannicii]